MTDDRAFAVLDIQNAQCDEITRADLVLGFCVTTSGEVRRMR